MMSAISTKDSEPDSRRSTRMRAAGSGYSTSCSAGRVRQLAADHSLRLGQIWGRSRVRALRSPRPRPPRGQSHRRSLVHPPKSPGRTSEARPEALRAAPSPLQSPRRPAPLGWHERDLPPSGSARPNRNGRDRALRAVRADRTAPKQFPRGAWCLQAVRHDLAPHLVHKFRRCPVGLGFEALQNLRLAERAQLQMPVTSGFLGSRDVERNGEPPLDQFEQFIINSVELGAQRGEPQRIVPVSLFVSIVPHRPRRVYRVTGVSKSPAARRRTGP